MRISIGIAISLFLLSACSSEPATLEEAVPNLQEQRPITRADGRKDLLLIIETRGIDAGKSDMFGLLSDALDALEWISANTPEYVDIRVNFILPATDQYGNPTLFEGGGFGWREDELGKINWDGINEWSLANLVSFVRTSVDGVEPVMRFCASDNGPHVQRFCQLAGN